MIAIVLAAYIGVADYCAWDKETKQWECNYETLMDCLSYNTKCVERTELKK